MREDRCFRCKLISAIKKDGILKRHVVLLKRYISCETVCDVKSSGRRLIVHQGVLEINTVSHEITGNSEAGESRGQSEYRADEFVVSAVVETKVEEPADYRYITILKQAFVGRRPKL